MPKKAKAKNFEVEDVGVSLVETVEIKNDDVTVPVNDEKAEESIKAESNEVIESNEVVTESNEVAEETPIQPPEESVIMKKKRTRAKPAIPKQKNKIKEVVIEDDVEPELPPDPLPMTRQITVDDSKRQSLLEHPNTEQSSVFVNPNKKYIIKILIKEKWRILGTDTNREVVSLLKYLKTHF